MACYKYNDRQFNTEEEILEYAKTGLGGIPLTNEAIKTLDLSTIKPIPVGIDSKEQVKLQPLLWEQPEEFVRRASMILTGPVGLISVPGFTQKELSAATKQMKEGKRTIGTLKLMGELINIINEGEFDIPSKSVGFNSSSYSTDLFIPYTAPKPEASDKYELFPGIIANKEQREAIDATTDFIINGNRSEWFTLIGKAGTGKTTILRKILEQFPKESKAVSALSHKAKNVLIESIGEDTLRNVSFYSLAGVLGKTMDQKTGKFFNDPKKKKFRKDPVEVEDIIVVDECSMVNEEGLKELMERKKPSAIVIFLGDVGQLPPIREEKSDLQDSDSPVFNTKNKATLLERVRQGEGSPILPFADNFWNNSTNENPNDKVINDSDRVNKITEKGNLIFADTSEILETAVEEFRVAIRDMDSNRMKIVTYKNDTADKLNADIHKELFGTDSEFNTGELVSFRSKFKIDEFESFNNADEVQVKSASRSDMGNGLAGYYLVVPYFNMHGIEEDIEVPVLDTRSKALHASFVSELFARAKALPDKSRESAAAYAHAWDEKDKYANLTYAYAVTSHKSQGSTYNTVVVLEDDIMGVKPTSGKTKSQSMYTAITRARNNAIIVSNKNPKNTEKLPIIQPAPKQKKIKTPPKQEVIKSSILGLEHAVRGEYTMIRPPKGFTPVVTSNSTEIRPKEYTNHSGGAQGYDAQWDIIGNEFGVTNHNHYLLPEDGDVADTTLRNKGVKPIDASPFIGIVDKTGQPKGVAQIEVTMAERAMGRIKFNHFTRNSKKIRNYAQVVNADAIFAIGSLIPIGSDITIARGQEIRKALVPQVNGGTSVAVQLGIMKNKPTYVFNQVKNDFYDVGWYKYNSNISDFEPTETPILTKNFAGIGTSSNTTEQGKQAIRDVYMKTFKVAPTGNNNQEPTTGNTLSSEIYNKLGNKTESENIEFANTTLRDRIKFAKDIGGVHSMREYNSTNFGNPFSNVEAEIKKGMIPTKGTKESVEKYIEWVLSEETDIDKERHKWIREELRSGKHKGKKIVYWKELKEPSHATALDYLINKHDWNDSLKNENHGEVKSGVSELFESNPELANAVHETLGLINTSEIQLDKPRFNPDNAEATSYPIKINGKYAGVISVDKDGYIASSIGMAGVELEKEFQGKGYGTKVYIALAEQLAKEGKTLKSEAFGKQDINEAANRVWKSLLDKGYAVDRGSYFEIQLKNKQQAQQLYSSYLQTTNNPTIEGFKQWNNRQQQINELFEADSELANEVYEALGFGQKGNNLSENLKSVINKIYPNWINNKNNELSLVSEFKALQLLSQDESTIKDRINFGKEAEKLINEIKKGKNPFTEDTTIEAQLPNLFYAYISGELAKDGISEKDMFLNLFNNNQLTSQQAQQLYSEYLESINKPNTNPILQGNQKPDVILPIGTSGSGKSTFIKSLPQENLVVIEPDSMRVEFTGYMNDKSKDKEIYIEAANRAIQAVKQGKQVVFDTTNLTKDKRLPFIEAIKKVIPTANIQYKLMELNPELAKQRIKADIAAGKNRANVPDSTIDRHAESYKQMLEDIKSEPISKYKDLGSQQDLQGFKDFVKNQPNIPGATQVKHFFTGQVKQSDFGPNDVMVFGANKGGFHGQGMAALAYANTIDNYRKWNPSLSSDTSNNKVGDFAVAGKTGLMIGNKGTGYGLITVSKPGVPLSSDAELVANISEMYEVAKKNTEKNFVVPYNSDTNLNKKTLLEMSDLFKSAGEIPSNVVFGDRLHTLIGDRGVQPNLPGATQVKPVLHRMADQVEKSTTKDPYTRVSRVIEGTHLKFIPGTHSLLEHYTRMFSQAKSLKDIPVIFKRDDSSFVKNLRTNLFGDNTGIIHVGEVLVKDGVRSRAAKVIVHTNTVLMNESENQATVTYSEVITDNGSKYLYIDPTSMNSPDFTKMFSNMSVQERALFSKNFGVSPSIFGYTIDPSSDILPETDNGIIDEDSFYNNDLDLELPIKDSNILISKALRKTNKNVIIYSSRTPTESTGKPKKVLKKSKELLRAESVLEKLTGRSIDTKLGESNEIDPVVREAAEYATRGIISGIGGIQVVMDNTLGLKSMGLPSALLSRKGFVNGKTVYINTDLMEDGTLEHELKHMWITVLGKNRPDLYRKLMDGMSKDAEFMETVKKNHPFLQGDALMEEALVLYSENMLSSGITTEFKGDFNEMSSWINGELSQLTGSDDVTSKHTLEQLAVLLNEVVQNGGSMFYEVLNQVTLEKLEKKVGMRDLGDKLQGMKELYKKNNKLTKNCN